MAKVVVGITMSVDGFMNDANGDIGKLYSDMAPGDVNAESSQQNLILQTAIRETGAVIFGENTFNMAEDADGYADGYEFQVPIFVLTSNPPAKHPKENENLTITFVTDGIESAVAQAKEAAGEKDVTIVCSANVAQQALNAGVVDEVQIDIMPFLFGSGARFFENITADIKLEKVKVMETPVRTHMRFRIVK